jgi:hypothetical protein
MPLIFITYDLKETTGNIHKLVKDTMKTTYGYSDKSPQKKYLLPNTCLLKDGTTPSQATEDLKACIKKHNGTLERFLACECGNYLINDLT